MWYNTERLRYSLPAGKLFASLENTNSQYDVEERDFAKPSLKIWEFRHIDRRNYSIDYLCGMRKISESDFFLFSTPSQSFWYSFVSGDVHTEQGRYK